DGVDDDGDGFCINRDCNDGDTVCGLGSCQDCPPESIVLTSPATAPVCVEPVEFMLDADGVQFAIESGALSCEGERTTVSFEDFEGVNLVDSGEWATNGDNGDRRAEIGGWPDNFDTESCPNEGSFARFVAEGSDRSIFYRGGFDARGLTDLRLGFTAASREAESRISVSACCAEDNCLGNRREFATLLVPTSACTRYLGFAEIPEEFEGCRSVELVITRSQSEDAILAIDDLTIEGSIAVEDISETGGGEYTFDVQACIPGEYSVTCMYEDDGVSLDSTSSVELVSE
ncbi:MAG: hypothetical protein AAF219_11200, partial [Myxococcota bacterium]